MVRPAPIWDGDIRNSESGTGNVFKGGVRGVEERHDSHSRGADSFPKTVSTAAMATDWVLSLPRRIPLLKQGASAYSPVQTGSDKTSSDMKRNPSLVSGLLIASLSLPFAQQAWSADRAKVAAIKKRAAKQAVPAPRPASTPITEAVPGGLRLSLTTRLRNVPATPVAAVAAMIPAAAVEQPATAAVPVVAVEPHALAPVAAAVAGQAAAAPGYPPPTYTPPVYTPRPVPMSGGRGENPYLPRPLPREAAAAPQASSGGFFSGLSQSIPLLPDSGQSILPKITKVYPTGEKPLVVVSFKCPTEVVGITPPTIKILHEAVSLGMAGINKTDLLSFDLQQVCQ